MADATLITTSNEIYVSDILNIYEAGVGETTNLSLRLTKGKLTVRNDYTVTGIESYDNITVQSGATLTVPDGAILTGSELNVNGTVDNNGQIIIYNGGALGKLLEYDEYSGNYQTTEMLDGTLRYEENLPDDAAVESLVVGVEPDSELQSDNIVGVWGVIDNIRDARNTALTTERIDLSVRVLARFDDYATISDVQTALEV